MKKMLLFILLFLSACEFTGRVRAIDGWTESQWQGRKPPHVNQPVEGS